MAVLSLCVGYIPQQLNHYGTRYAEICHSAVPNVEQSQQKQKKSDAEFRTLSRLQSDPSARLHKTLAQSTTPLKPIADKAKPYHLSYSKQHSISPFYMPDGHPQKYFMAGYTGFVPTARNHFGQSYPSITSIALREHKEQSDKLSKSWNEPVSVFSKKEKKVQTSTVYPKGSGLVPHYTGHVPGECMPHIVSMMLLQLVHNLPLANFNQSIFVNSIFYCSSSAHVCLNALLCVQVRNSSLAAPLALVPGTLHHEWSAEQWGPLSDGLCI